VCGEKGGEGEEKLFFVVVFLIWKIGKIPTPRRLDRIEKKETFRSLVVRNSSLKFLLGGALSKL
jgi:hypothetical protein